MGVSRKRKKGLGIGRRGKCHKVSPSRRGAARPAIRAWVAEAWIDAQGHHREPQAVDAIPLFAVSVHEMLSPTIPARMNLLVDVMARFAARVPEDRPSLWAFPGGYFGGDWTGIDESLLEQRLRNAAAAFPTLAAVAAGVDHGGYRTNQGAWVLQLNRQRDLEIRRIVRAATPLHRRVVHVGGLEAVVFVCGEFTGSYTQPNGPYNGSEMLSDPAQQLLSCRLLVDLAHSRVPGSVYKVPSPRWVHQIQMESFSLSGAGLLTHHHGGELVEGRAKFDCASNWIIYRGRTWLDDQFVSPIP